MLTEEETRLSMRTKALIVIPFGYNWTVNLGRISFSVGVLCYFTYVSNGGSAPDGVRWPLSFCGASAVHSSLCRRPRLFFGTASRELHLQDMHETCDFFAGKGLLS